MPVEGPGTTLPHASKDDKVVPQSFKSVQKGQSVVCLRKASHGARFRELVSNVDIGKITLSNTKEYKEDNKGNVPRQQNKGDVQFDGEAVGGSWLIQKGGKAKSAKERVAQRAWGRRAERAKRKLEVYEDDDDEGGDPEDEEFEEGAEETEEEDIVEESDEDKPKRRKKLKGKQEIVGPNFFPRGGLQ